MIHDYMQKTVCKHKTVLSSLYMPFINLVNFSNVNVFLTTWGIYILIVLILYFLPCNSNYNCDMHTDKKNLLKTMGFSFILFILLLLLLSVNAKAFLC